MGYYFILENCDIQHIDKKTEKNTLLETIVQ